MGLGDHRTVSSVRLRAGNLAAKDRDLVPQAIREAAEVYRELAAARPDAFRPDLATSLTNLSGRLAIFGRELVDVCVKFHAARGRHARLAYSSTWRVMAVSAARSSVVPGLGSLR